MCLVGFGEKSGKEGAHAAALIHAAGVSPHAGATVRLVALVAKSDLICTRAVLVLSCSGSHQRETDIHDFSGSAMAARAAC